MFAARIPTHGHSGFKRDCLGLKHVPAGNLDIKQQSTSVVSLYTKHDDLILVVKYSCALNQKQSSLGKHAAATERVPHALAAGCQVRPKLTEVPTNASPSISSQQLLS